MDEKHQHVLEQISPVVEVLLERFSGMESVIEEPSEIPARLIACTVEKELPRGDGPVLDALARLPLFAYRVAALPRRDVWDPRVEPYGAFLRRNSEANIRWWVESDSLIPEAQIRAWLEELKQCGRSERKH